MKIYLLILLVLVLLLCGCAPQATPTVLTATQPQPADVQPSIPPTDTPQPTLTAEPGKVILVAPPGTEAQQVQAVVSELSAMSGLSLETVQDLQPGGVMPNTRVVVFLAAPGNLSEILSSAPQVQFAVVADVDLPAAANLTVLRQRIEFQAFVGGFISVLLSTDWRSGGLLPSDSPLGASLQDAFINGGRYFCGTCAAGWPLGVYYPQVTLLPAASDGNSWQAAAAGLFDNMKVEAYYLSSDAAKPEVLAYLQGKDQFGKLLLVVSSQPPPDGLRGQWAATVSFDTPAALRQVWPDLLAGKGGAVIETRLLLTDINPENLGEGRLRLVNELIAEIQAGKIYPFTLPAE